MKKVSNIKYKMNKKLPNIFNNSNSNHYILNYIYYIKTYLSYLLHKKVLFNGDS